MDVEEGTEFVDVCVAVDGEVDEGRDVERSGRAFVSESQPVSFEVVVAVDQDARVLRWDDFGEGIFGELREGEVDGALDVAELEFAFTTRVEDHGFSIGRVSEKFFLGQTAGFSQDLSFFRRAEMGREVDLAIWNGSFGSVDYKD